MFNNLNYKFLSFFDIVKKYMFFVMFVEMFENFLRDNKKIMGLRLIEKRETLKNIDTIILKDIKIV